MKNISDLSNELQQIFEQLKNDSIDIKKASELNNTAGKIISVYKTQLSYAALRGDKPDIKFLADDSNKE